MGEENASQIPVPASSDPSPESSEVIYDRPIKTLEDFREYFIFLMEYSKKISVAHFSHIGFDPNKFDQKDFDFWKFALMLITSKYKMKNSTTTPDTIKMMFNGPAAKYTQSVLETNDNSTRISRDGLSAFLKNIIGSVDFFDSRFNPDIEHAPEIFRQNFMHSTALNPDLISARSEYK